MERQSIHAFCGRFEHIDGTIVDVRCRGASVREVVVRFYPWFEHPDYVRHVIKGGNRQWRFDDVEQGLRDITIHVDGFRAAYLTGPSATDVALFREHRLLWPYSRTATVYCNSPLALIDTLRSLERSVPGAPSMLSMLEWINPAALRAIQPPYMLGHLPEPLWTLLRAELDKGGVDYFATPVAGRDEMPLLLTLDDSYVIAHDFQVDVPDFEHRPEWFTCD